MFASQGRESTHWATCHEYRENIFDSTIYICFLIFHKKGMFFAKLHTRSQNLNYNYLLSMGTWHAKNDTYKKVALNGKEKRYEIYVTTVKYHVSTN
jgi:hypothetical protein